MTKTMRTMQAILKKVPLISLLALANSAAATAEQNVQGLGCYTNSQYNCFFSHLLPYFIIVGGLALFFYLRNQKKINSLPPNRKAALIIILVAALFGGSLLIQKFFLVNICT